ncbi:MAG: proton-conducting transporter membrane subunit, partial [Nitrospiraceae bacterium]|nr:proton-conducting transporter membrane subunit [Nitrospiraceae bacterium]
MATGLAAVVPERSLRYTYLLMFVGAVFAGAGSVLAVYAPPTVAYVSSIIEYIPVSFAAGPLSGFFGLVLSAIAAPVSLYSAGYSPEGRTKAVLYGLFVLSLYALFFSADAVSFIIAWEAMSIFSYFLVISHTEDQEAGRAGLVYSVMTHAGTALILAAFFVAYAVTGRFDFDGMRAGLAGSPDWIRSVIFCLSFLGFGMKAAIIPLHLWLPRAHPAAPSNVSALMSGIMVKAGIYGMLLMGFYVLGANVAWWGMVILVTGIICSVLGVLYVLMEHDIKRLLAY